MSESLAFILTFVLRVAAMIFLLRFVLQAVRASFYNPFCEGIVRFTDPLLRPVRLLLRPYRNLDLASFAMAWVAHVVAVAIHVLANALPLDALYVLNDALHLTLSWVVNIFLLAIFVTILMSWLAPGVYSPAANIAREIAEPVLAPARRVLPPLGGLDLSPMVTILGLFIIQGFVLSALLPYRLWVG